MLLLRSLFDLHLEGLLITFIKVLKKKFMRRAKKMLILPKKKDRMRDEVEEIRSILEATKVPIQRIDSELVGNDTIVWLTTPQEKKAKEVLNKRNVKAFTSEIVVIKLVDRPGELAKIARILNSSNITIEDAHLILKSQKYALYGLQTDKPSETAKMIKKIEQFEEEREKNNRQPGQFL